MNTHEPMNATAPTIRDKFCDLLRELFQFEHSAGLDFGIYRIMNHKREVIEKFISKDLADAIDQSAQAAVRGARAERLAALNGLAEKVNDAFGKDALDADGNLVKGADLELGKRYQQAQQAAHNILGESEMEAGAFSHLHAFFSRYFDAGDFISKRRYSRRARYAIPYNGEEVHLHWANRDSYYIKTGEYFSHYAFQCGDYRVRFELHDADVEQDNRKGAQRFFIPLHEKVRCDGGEVVVPFVFRPLNGGESNGNGNGRQDALIKDALPGIAKNLDAPAKAALLSAADGDGDDSDTTVLEKHMRRYARRNTADYFIHKDLRGFLIQELDFYIKNEVLNLDDLAQAGELAGEGRFHLMRIVRAIGVNIIEFLAQIENFQKQLFEKKKFVIDTHYCVAAGRIADATLRKEILANKAQWAEWAAFAGKKVTGAKARGEFMDANPTLMVDTAHFGAEFKDNLLAQFDDIDGDCDGVLLSGENFQGLNLLAEKYRGQVKCIYIDPPYNTDASAILYKNDYKHSSWLSLMENRLTKAKQLLPDNGILCCAIDDEEAWRLQHLMPMIFEREVGTVSVRSNPAGRKSSGQFSPSHEYALFYGKSNAVPGVLIKTQKELDQYPLSDETGRFSWSSFVRTGTGDRREDRPKMFYPIYVGANDSLRVPKMEWDETNEEYQILEQPKADEVAVWPVGELGGKKIEKRWHRGWERVTQEVSEYRVRRNGNGEISISFKTYMDEESMPKTWWEKGAYASANGTRALGNVLPDNPFDFPKSVELVKDCLRASGAVQPDVNIVDFFAGSGTTGHAVINLNREDGGRRKFILMEMGEYFDSVLLPRLKKVAWTPEWKDGKPRRAATEVEVARAPRMFKVQRLESYEDALDNIAFTGEDRAQRMMKFPDYLLGYMLKWETRGSQTLLNVANLEAPFAYELRVRRNGDHSNTRVDVAETFNYLLGLHVQTRKIYTDKKRRYLVYTGQVGGRAATVIWRDTQGWDVADFEREREFVDREKLTAGADVVYVNNTSIIPGSESLDGLFKRQLLGSD
ncbi:MAG: site-specific DNA-methyltransferase [Gammaproteobacteria bacterium]|nr:site-specific DNA-methyltransferase [Gammaproteobacteria bacterium]